MKKYKLKYISIILSLSFILCAILSCGTDSVDMSPDKILSDIIKSYQTNGMTSWWEIAAVYNAGENPTHYVGFDEILNSLDGSTILKTASYVTVVNIAVATSTNADEEYKQYFSEYEPYKAQLKDFLENPSADNTINNYIYAYYALKCSGMIFDETAFVEYMVSAQKDDGGYSLSGNTGDVDVTAAAIQALQLLASYNSSVGVKKTFDGAVIFLETNINENGTFSSYDTENANSTACAISALISCTNEDAYSTENQTLKNAIDGLAVFKMPKETGYSYKEGDKNNNPLATAQAAIALSDVKNKTSVWETLYIDSLSIFAQE